jgi:Arc/MetJ family transcription regulator
MKRTTIVLDEKLVRQGLKATGIKTLRALINHALTELVRRGKNGPAWAERPGCMGRQS